MKYKLTVGEEGMEWFRTIIADMRHTAQGLPKQYDHYAGVLEADACMLERVVNHMERLAKEEEHANAN